MGVLPTVARGPPNYRVELATNTSIASVISSRLGVPKCMTVMHTIYSHTRRHSLTVWASVLRRAAGCSLSLRE